MEAAIGAALLPVIGCGLAHQDDASWITLVERALPRPTSQAVYDKVFEIYAGLYPTLTDSMHKLSDMRG